MNLSIRDVAKLSGAEIFQPRSLRGKRFTGVSTDSRSIAPGNLFIALRGEKFDGHAFAVQAAEAGASAVLVDAKFDRTTITNETVIIVVVPDTAKALGELAWLYRLKFDIPVIAIGGSNGKTTTKEMITAVLQKKYKVLATEGNLNNHIGVPMMLFRLKPSHRMAVLELGTNHFGELAYLCSIALPTHAVITNIGREHLEFFGDLKGVAKEETELYNFLEGSFGAAYVNADDPYLKNAATRLAKKISYGISSGAEIRATHVRVDDSGRPAFDCRAKRLRRPYHFTLGATGLHNVQNALAAIAVGTSFGIPFSAAGTALEEFTSASKRMEILVRNGLTILNDTYNANPDSMRAALQTLMSMKSKGKKIAVLGDMKELGAGSEREHAAIGSAVRTLKPDVLVTYGALAEHIASAARIKQSHHCSTKQQAIEVVKSLAASGDTVLVKGSRSMAMEDIVAHL
jgi:UDP-N-acetylmuramoyl-tripeptide--D-alanyl-D-alanine ligase